MTFKLNVWPHSFQIKSNLSHPNQGTTGVRRERSGVRTSWVQYPHILNWLWITVISRRCSSPFVHWPWKISDPTEHWGIWRGGGRGGSLLTTLGHCYNPSFCSGINSMVSIYPYSHQLSIDYSHKASMRRFHVFTTQRQHPVVMFSIHSCHMTTDQERAMTPCDQELCLLTISIKLFRTRQDKVMQIVMTN